MRWLSEQFQDFSNVSTLLKKLSKKLQSTVRQSHSCFRNWT